MFTIKIEDWAHSALKAQFFNIQIKIFYLLQKTKMIDLEVSVGLSADTNCPPCSSKIGGEDSSFGVPHSHSRIRGFMGYSRRIKWFHGILQENKEVSWDTLGEYRVFMGYSRRIQRFHGILQENIAVSWDTLGEYRGFQEYLEVSWDIQEYRGFIRYSRSIEDSWEPLIV